MFVLGSKKRAETVEDHAEKAIKAKKRKEIESEKKEKMKKKTLDTLLKKKDSKAAKQLKTTKSIREAPTVVYRQNSAGALLSFPAGCDYPLAGQPPREPPRTVLCSVCSAAPKKYSCSVTGSPLCSLECYKINLASRPG